jgi:hypothetical protein
MRLRYNRIGSFHVLLLVISELLEQNPHRLSWVDLQGVKIRQKAIFSELPTRGKES